VIVCARNFIQVMINYLFTRHRSLTRFALMPRLLQLNFFRLPCLPVQTMTKKKELTEAQRGAIIYCRQRGDTISSIAKTVGCGRTTVHDTVKRYAETGRAQSKKRSGRPLALNTPQRERLKRLVTKTTKNRRLCAAGVKNLWKAKTGQEVCTRTVRRALHSTGLRNCIARSKPLVSAANKEARLTWCQRHASWTVEDWRKVLWSDESTFSQFQQSRNCRVWREPNDEWSASCLSATVKHSPSIMHWGCFSGHGMGPIVPLDCSVTGAAYVGMLRWHAVPTFRRTFPRRDGWFQHDNATPHTSKVAKAFLEKSGMQVLDWPAQSPDINPIENLWAIVKQSIRQQKKQPTNLAQLKRRVKAAWKAIPKETITNLVDSMPRRIQAVIAAEGGPTRY